MTTLFYAPGTCSLSPHIALREAGLLFDLVLVDLRAKKTERGDDYLQIAPKGYVPALQLDDGSVLTEGTAIVQYIADQAPEKRLAPPAGTRARYQLEEWLTYIATELHKANALLFSPTTPDAFKQFVTETAKRRWSYVNDALSGREYLVGETFTVADGYLFWALRSFIYLAKYQPEGPLKAHLDRVAARPAVQVALAAEGRK